MKFVCDSLDLSAAALTVVKACATRTLTPVLECIRIRANNDEVSLSAYDGELSIEKNLKADVLEEGEICVNGRLFTDFIGKIFHTQLTLSTEEKGLEIRYDDSRSFMQTLPAEDFPVLTGAENVGSFEVEEGKFKNLVARSVFCCATDDSRPILKGCLLETEDGLLKVSSLDGYRMATTQCEISGGDNGKKIVCPARTLAEIARMLTGGEKLLKIEFSVNQLRVEVDDTKLISRLYVGEFVKKENIFPPAFSTEVTVRREELIESAERASVLIRGEKNNLIIMDVKSGAVYVTANSEIGNVAEKVNASLEGKEIRIAMNGKYLLDALKALDEEEIVLYMNTPIAPFVLKNKQNQYGAYLILPVRTTS
ncbi:MAG: DNA polymerase III subunit beta [Candidatus Scatosoma sp.]